MSGLGKTESGTEMVPERPAQSDEKRRTEVPTQKTQDSTKEDELAGDATRRSEAERQVPGKVGSSHRS